MICDRKGKKARLVRNGRLIFSVPVVDSAPVQLYNYARIFTAAQNLRQLKHGFSSALVSLCAGTGRPEKTVNGQAYDLQVRPMPETALSGNTLQMAVFNDLPPPHEPRKPYLMAAYIDFRQIPLDLLQNFLISAFFGLTIFWTAVGAGIYVSYNTSDVGIGCRSGFLLLYGRRPSSRRNTS